MRDYNKEAKDTSDHKYSYGFDNLMHGYMMRTFSSFSPKGKALEMGCYHGDFTELLLKHFDDVSVIEASQECVEVTRKRVGEKVKFTNSTFENFNSIEKYDSIFLMHTLEHLDHPVEILNKVNSWLSDKGQLFLVCPNANAPSRQIAVKMGLITHNSAITPAEKEHGHRNTYSLDTLEREARQAGLEVRHRGGVFFKALANFQFDKLMGTDVLSDEYMEGCYQLGMIYPDLCASVYLVCTKGK